jgi:glutamate racemase
LNKIVWGALALFLVFSLGLSLGAYTERRYQKGYQDVLMLECTQHFTFLARKLMECEGPYKFFVSEKQQTPRYPWEY